METEVARSKSGLFERFFVWFLIPLIFTSVLLGVLLSIFDYNIMNGLLKVGSQIPGMNRILPSPSGSAEEAPLALTIEEQLKQQQVQDEAEIIRLNNLVTMHENELKLAAKTVQEHEQANELLRNELHELQVELEGKRQTEEEYEQQIRQLASTYAAMLPSRSAPIIELLTPQEQVLILSHMRQENRVKILEKMNPQVASEVSIMLKDVVPSKDREIAALQERLLLNEEKEVSNVNKLTADDHAETFRLMNPKQAAGLLEEMAKFNEDHVIVLLSTMDNVTRSRILTALADVSPELAAEIVTELTSDLN